MVSLLFQKELFKYMSKLSLRLKLNPLLLGLSSFALIAVGDISEADAAAITFTGSANSRGALVTFDTRETNLIVRLTNTSSADVLFPEDVLTNVFFNLSGDPRLRRVSALVPSGSGEVHGMPSMLWGRGNVGAGWGYSPDVNIASLPTVNQGLSATNLFGPLFNFPGPSLRPGGGVDWGLVGPGDNPATGSRFITFRTGLIQDSVVFTLSGLPIDFNPATDVSNVFFQYGRGDFTMAGTPNSSPNSQNVPEPSTIAGLLTISLAALRFCGKSKLNN